MIVWVAGEPGIGKTALIDQFVRDLGRVVCIRGQCVEQYGTGEPYLPVLEALAELCRLDGGAAALMRSVAPTWLLRLPWLSAAEERDALRREFVGISTDRMLREMGELLDRYTEGKPVLLVTEDLHWSDRATLQLIDYVARRRTSARLMWLASFRLAEVIALDHPLNPLRHELRLHGLCDEIVLDPFSESEVADFVARLSPSMARDEAFVRALHERTDGLPLFVASVMTDVLARGTHGDDEQIAATLLARMAVPENLAAIIDHYIAKLGPDQRVVLEAAAVCGVEFRVCTVSAALDRDALWVGRICEELRSEQRWLAARRPGEEVAEADLAHSFRHALFRQVLYGRIAPSARAMLHRRVATALEAERAAGAQILPAEIARHFERGRERMAALRYYAEAAETALAHLSPAECMNLTERALTLLEQGPVSVERTALEITLATLRGISATQALGVTGEAKRAFQRAYALAHDASQHPAVRRLLHGFGFLLSLRGDYAEALAVADRAEMLSAETNDPVLTVVASIVHGEVDQLQGRSQEARTWIERGLAAAGPLDVAPGETSVADPQVTLLGLSAIELLRLGLVVQARARLDRAHARARQLKHPMSRLVAMWFDALFEVRLGNAQRVALVADEMRALVEEFGLAHGRAGCRWFRAWADARTGQPRDAYGRIRAAYEENARLGMVAGGSEVLGYAAEAALLADDLEAAERQVDEALQLAKTLGERVYLPQLFLIEGAIARAQGQPAIARASVRRAVEEARTQEAPWLELMALLEVCEHDGATAKDRQALAALVDRLPEAADTNAVAKARVLLGKTKVA